MGVCELCRLVYGDQRVRDGPDGMFDLKRCGKCSYDSNGGTSRVRNQPSCDLDAGLSVGAKPLYDTVKQLLLFQTFCY